MLGRTEAVEPEFRRFRTREIVRPPIRRKPRGSYHHGDLERALVEAAVRTIQDQGAAALTLRAVGARLGVSRTALYRHFEDKTALLARVGLEGFRLFEAALLAAIADAARQGRDPLETMAAAYVDFALANPAHYETMFGKALDDWSRYPDLEHQANATFELLVNTIGERTAARTPHRSQSRAPRRRRLVPQSRHRDARHRPPAGTRRARACAISRSSRIACCAGARRVREA